MFKKAILSFGAAVFMASGAFAQTTVPCNTDEHHKQQVSRFPQILENQAELERDVQAYVNQELYGISRTNAANKGTAHWDTIIGYNTFRPDSDYRQLYIPIVVHIIHNYGSEYISDDKIYNMITGLNVYYNKRNADTASVIQPFKKYIGNARITFYLATKDPLGQPTTGITRHYSPSTAGGDEYAKLGQWPANRYLNIWSEQRIGRGITGGIVAAYSRFPADGNVNPFGDGIITNFTFVGGNDKTLEHEIGHYLNLNHVWASNGGNACLGPDCGDDAVDDTPPTKGHFSGSCPGQGCPLYDTVCATGYKKTYTYISPTIIDSIKVRFNASGDTIKINGIVQRDTFRNHSVTAIVDFPDTVNTQNIMDYSDCTNMFTVGQVMRMRGTLLSDATTRSNLTKDSNLLITGAWSAPGVAARRPDMAPIADFSTNRNFVCANTTFILTNRSWRDTVTAADWTISNGSPATSTSLNTLTTTSTQPGWVNISLTAKSKITVVDGSGVATRVDSSGSLTRSDLVYAADPNPVNALDYYQDFREGSDVDQFPIFNFYKNPNYRWEVIKNTGFYDSSSIMFHNYDPRPVATNSNQTQNPAGNFADFYTRAFDITGSEFSSRAQLTFYSAGAFRTVSPAYQNDSLVIYFSTDCGVNWTKLGKLDKGSLANNGYLATPFTPSWMGEWKLNGFTIPSGAKTAKTFFRFRFFSGTDNGAISGYSWGTGNNFYLDRLNITQNALGVNGAELADKGMTLTPNPTNGAASVNIKGGDNSRADIIVTDVTGKLVYRTEAKLSTAVTTVNIPADRISVKGMYMVQVVTNGKSQTQKLVVY